MSARPRCLVQHRCLLSTSAFTLAFLVACGSAAGHNDAPTAPQTPVAQPQALTTLSVMVATVQAGQTTTAVITALDQHGATMTVGVPGWTTSTPSIATISASGVVTAIAAGQTMVIARVGDVQGSALFVVTPSPAGPAPVAFVTLSPFVASIEPGRTLQLFVTPKDFAGNSLTGREISWTSSDTTIARVSTSGLVYALATGTAIIEAISEGKHGAFALSVTAAIDTDIVVFIPIPVAHLVVGDTMTVIATVQSPFPIMSVIAIAGGKQTPMRFGPIGGGGRAQGWSVTLDLSTIPIGPYDLVVVATDAREHRGLVTVPFERNPKVSGGSKGPTGNK